MQRYARQLVLALDQLLATGQFEVDVVLVAPAEAKCDLDLNYIEFLPCGIGSGHFWEQTSLPLASIGGYLLNLCNSAPVFKSDQAVVVHDASIFRHPEFFSLKYRMVHKAIVKMWPGGVDVFTVSEFSARELAEVLGRERRDIIVVPNGSEHLLKSRRENLNDEYGIAPKRYFVCVGSLSPNKNIKVAVDAVNAQEDIDVKLVVCGGGNYSVFNDGGGISGRRVVLTGRVSDAEIASLMYNSAALIFPSIYEGFGIPPLEAFSQRCPVIASTAEAVKEVCGAAASYFEPHDVEELIRLMKEHLVPGREIELRVEEGVRRLDLYSWGASAEILARAIFVR